MERLLYYIDLDKASQEMGLYAQMSYSNKTSSHSIFLRNDPHLMTMTPFPKIKNNVFLLFSKKKIRKENKKKTGCTLRCLHHFLSYLSAEYKSDLQRQVSARICFA